MTFDLETDLANFVFDIKQRKAAYLSLEYKALQIATRIKKTLDENPFPTCPFQIINGDDIGLAFAKALDVAHSGTIPPVKWLALIPSTHYSIMELWLNERLHNTTIRLTSSDMIADNKSIDNYCGFIGSFLGVTLYTDFFLAEKFKFIENPVIVYSNADSPWWETLLDD